MFRMVLRKMVGNRRLVACQLLGVIFAAATVSSVPIYTAGVLQRMLTRDLEEYQRIGGMFPGSFVLSVNGYNLDERVRDRLYDQVEARITPQLFNDLGVPPRASGHHLSRDYMRLEPAVPREDRPPWRGAYLDAMANLPDHVTILRGRMYNPEPVDGVYEVIGLEAAVAGLELQVGELYVATDLLSGEKLELRLVGTFGFADEQDLFWYQGGAGFSRNLMMDYDRFVEAFVRREPAFRFLSRWYVAFDYHRLRVEDVGRFLSTHQSLRSWLADVHPARLDVPAVPVLETYSARERQLRTTLWVLQTPVLLMLVFYLYMVSGLTVEHETNEIAVMKSRGAGSRQVFRLYLLEGLVLGALAVIAGPPLGYQFCRLIGASRGFLEFVQRTALPLRMSLQAYLYATIAAAIAIATMLVPAHFASRTTIVLHKQQRSRSTRHPLWRRAYLDVVLVVSSLYALYQYGTRQADLATLGITSEQVAVDPLLFVVSTLFVTGAGLLFLRTYPLLVRLLFSVGRFRWPPALYAALLQVGRAGERRTFLMLFLILSLSIGLFSANAARTLNQNAEDRIAYAVGADVVLQLEWPSSRPPDLSATMGPAGPQAPGSVSLTTEAPTVYREPPFELVRNLPGIEGETKVFRRDRLTVDTVVGGSVPGAQLMAIVPHEFGRVAWFRRDLLPHHWHSYLNLLSRDPQAALISRSMATEHTVREGDVVWVSWADQAPVQLVVHGIVEHWPTYNPHQRLRDARLHQIVMNLEYLHAKLLVEPYEVWLRKQPGATSEELYAGIRERDLPVLWLRDADQEIVRARNDPLLQGTNGSLTLGFLVTMSVCMVGFLIYWIISIQERTLQFGVFRAMGMRLSGVVGMLAGEQLLVSGVGIAAAAVIGVVASRLFVPLFQIAARAEEQVPPFRIVMTAADLGRLGGVVALIVGAGLGVLAFIVARIRVHQAIKLGEE